MPALSLVDPWPVRAAWSLARLLGIERPSDPPANGDAAIGIDQRPAFDPRAGMAAFAAFPWVFACCQAILEDLGSRPWILSRGEGASAERIDTHPILDLLRRPSSQTSARDLWDQLRLDRENTGNAYALILFERSGQPISLVRLHPARVVIEVDQLGRIASYTYEGAGPRTTYAPAAILHWRGASWVDDPRRVYGTGAIEALVRELESEHALRSRAATSSRRGRPDAIARPAAAAGGIAGVWSASQVAQFAETINKAFSAQDGGVVVLGGQAEITPLSWSPKDMELPEQRRLTREATLAVYSVPPTRLQLPTANYAQSTDAMVQYWTTLVNKSQAFCDLLNTRLVPLFRDARGLRVSQGFEDVSYLQSARSARLDRVSRHIQNGMSAPAAYAYEGFADAPIEAAKETP